MQAKLSRWDNNERKDAGVLHWTALICLCTGAQITLGGGRYVGNTLNHAGARIYGSKCRQKNQAIPGGQRPVRITADA